MGGAPHYINNNKYIQVTEHYTHSSLATGLALYYQRAAAVTSKDFRLIHVPLFLKYNKYGGGIGRHRGA